MMTQSPQAYRISEGENRTAALPPLRIYKTALDASHLGGYLCAALVAMFPGINFVLLDSNCLPIALFEVEELWTEAYSARFLVHSNSRIPRVHPLRAFKRFCNDLSKVVDTQQQVGSARMEWFCYLSVITSTYFNWNAWLLRLKSSSGAVTDGVFKDEASTLVCVF